MISSQSNVWLRTWFRNSRRVRLSSWIRIGARSMFRSGVSFTTKCTAVKLLIRPLTWSAGIAATQEKPFRLRKCVSGSMIPLNAFLLSNPGVFWRLVAAVACSCSESLRTVNIMPARTFQPGRSSVYVRR